jgi:hypothetical protein
MIRIPIIIVALYWSIVCSYAQSPIDSSAYVPRKLKVDEVNLVSSYYHQDGNNAAVTGGIGSERLNDFATTINVRLSKPDRRARINTYTVEVGVDAYSSASSDKIDPLTISSASYSDKRIYPSLSWSRTNEKNGTTIGATGSLSTEFDYFSLGGGVNGYKTSKDKSRQLGLKLQTYQDAVTLIFPIEQRAGKNNGATQARKTYSAELSLSQIINQRLQILLLMDLAYQNGLLSLPFNRVYFSDKDVGIERLPSSRFKIPVSIRANYFLGDRTIIRMYYRYYKDDWGLSAHTAELETAVKLTPFISVSPFYRYYTQTAIDYFAAYGQHNKQESYYSSDYDLSKFNSHFFGAGFRIISPDGLLGIHKFNTFEIRYGHYSRQTGLTSNIITMNMKFK